MTRALVIAVAFGACAVEPPEPMPLPVGDPAVFAARAQPVLAGACGDPSCHGRDDRPLAIFSPGRHRADPARRFLDEPLTDDELAANARAIAAFALDAMLAGEPVDACLVLRKPLARAAGGCAHSGGEIFDGRDDRGYAGLLAYLRTLSLPEAP